MLGLVSNAGYENALKQVSFTENMLISITEKQKN